LVEEIEEEASGWIPVLWDIFIWPSVVVELED